MKHKTNKRVDASIHGDDRNLTFYISERVLEQIKSTLGTEKPELGGVLGYDEEEGMINNFFLDQGGETSSATYRPDTKAIDKLLTDDWELRGISFLGIIHSHPCGFNRPSLPDIEYATLIANDFDMDFVFLPIVTSDYDSRFDIVGYYVTKEGKLHRASIVVVEEEDETEGRDEFTRINEVIDVNHMSECTVVGVGCGGARNFFIDMARLGVGNFILIDGDSYAVTNIGSQGAYHSEMGRLKVETIRDLILDVNPEANVTCCPFMLDNKVTDQWFERNVINKSDKAKMILCSFTDSAKAMLRCANIASKYELNFITGSHYQGGYISELVFSCPEAGTSDPREMLAQRFEAVCSGNEVKATSEGSPVFVANRLMALAEKIATGILLYSAHKESKYCEFLAKPHLSTIFIRETTLSGWDESWQEIFTANDEDTQFDDLLWFTKDNVGDESIHFNCITNDDTRILKSFSD